MNAATLDRLNELDPIHYSEDEALGLLGIEPNRIEAWQVRGAIAWFLNISTCPDVTSAQAQQWRGGRRAAEDHFGLPR